MSNIQINYLLRLWPEKAYQIDDSFDCRVKHLLEKYKHLFPTDSIQIGRKEKLIELALRRSSASFVLKQIYLI